MVAGQLDQVGHRGPGPVRVDDPVVGAEHVRRRGRDPGRDRARLGGDPPVLPAQPGHRPGRPLRRAVRVEQLDRRVRPERGRPVVVGDLPAADPAPGHPLPGPGPVVDAAAGLGQHRGEVDHPPHRRRRGDQRRDQAGQRVGDEHDRRRPGSAASTASAYATAPAAGSVIGRSGGDRAVAAGGELAPAAAPAPAAVPAAVHQRERRHPRLAAYARASPGTATRPGAPARPRPAGPAPGSRPARPRRGSRRTAGARCRCSPGWSGAAAGRPAPRPGRAPGSGRSRTPAAGGPARRPRRGPSCSRVTPNGGEVLAGQVDPAAAEVLADVADEVRQLERDPEVDRVRLGDLARHDRLQHRHHLQPDHRGRAVHVAHQVVVRRVAR